MESQKMLRSKSEENCRSVFQKKYFSPNCSSEHLKSSFVNFERKIAESQQKFQPKFKKWRSFSKIFFVKVSVWTFKRHFCQLYGIFLVKCKKSFAKNPNMYQKQKNQWIFFVKMFHEHLENSFDNFSLKFLPKVRKKIRPRSKKQRIYQKNCFPSKSSSRS